MLLIFISILLSYLICIKYVDSINKYFYIYFIFLTILIYFIINKIFYYVKYKKIYENLDMLKTGNDKSFTIPQIDLNDYGNININIENNTQKSTNKILNDKIYTDNNDIENINNISIIPKKFNKTAIYGQYAWTNNPDFYIPSADGIY